jgi:hypothetical protein
MNVTPLLLNPPNQKNASHGRELDHEQAMGYGVAIQYLCSPDKPDYHPAGISTITVGCCIAASSIVINEICSVRSRNDYLSTAGTYLGPVGAVSEMMWLASAAGKISRDPCREYDPTTTRAGLTAVCHIPPIRWLVTAASPIVIGEDCLNAKSGNDYLLTGGTLLGSFGAVSQLRR